jgi:hypothetical protein
MQHRLKYIEEKLAEKRGAKPKAKEEKKKPDDGRLREVRIQEACWTVLASQPSDAAAHARSPRVTEPLHTTPPTAC